MNKLLRYSRITIEAIFALMITAMLVDYSMGTVHIAGWLARIQFMPSCLTLSFGLIVLWIALTLIFGRVYCSSVCPLGALQDLISHVPSLSKKKRPLRLRRKYAKPETIRYAAIALFISGLLGATTIVSYLEPYTVYSRMAVYILKPIVGSAENLIADLGDFTGLWTIAFVNVGIISLAGILISTITLAVIAYLSVRYGRMYCNTLCPVGSTLGIVSRYSIFHIDIDTDKCIRCNKCVRICKSECINGIDHTVDASRCVVCFNCINVCDNNAISYTTRRKRLSDPLMQRIQSIKPRQSKVSTSGIDSATKTTSSPKLMDRRKFLMTGVVVASAPIIAKASSSKTNHIKPVELDNEPMIPARHVTPPGTKSRADFMDHCTGCGLCISHCTSHVLRPSTDQYGYRHALKPVMVFSDSWCYYNCTRCTTVCPTGALNPLTRKEKHNFTNGLAQVELSNCQSATGSHCGACSRRCPNDAISMKAINGNNGMCPVVDASRCTGCGACEYICPASPVKAIVINGNH